MTRFARAKGSKASNERKPEEATSWSEMRKNILSKESERKINNNFHKGEIEIENKEKEKEKEKEKKKEKEKETEWASLGDDNFSVSQLKQHLKVKKNKKEVETGEGKKKKLMDGKEEENCSVNGKSIRKKKGKNVDTEEKKNKLVDKGKKRKKSEDEEISVEKKKKKMCEKNGINEEKDKVNFKKLKKKELKNLKKGKNECEEKKEFERKEKRKFQSKKLNEIGSSVEELIINGEKIKIVKFQGFYVTLEDAERLKKLRFEMKKEGISKDKLEAAIKLERRRAEKALSRLKKNVCFHCRGRGHLLSNCPELQEKPTTGTGICYKCGSTEHSAGECRVVRGAQFQFAECFICREQGHIARQCPDNPRGLYPQGGACRECGDVTHLRKDCPRVLSQKEEEAVTVATRSERDLECLDEEIANREKEKFSKKKLKKNSTVKF